MMDGAIIMEEGAKVITRDQLEDFAKSLAEGRDECIKARDESGCEARWDIDQAFYDGKEAPDQPALKKPRDGGAPASFDEDKEQQTEESGSTVFDNITKFFTDLLASRAADMMTPIDERPFNINPTPVPDVAKLTEDPTPLKDPAKGVPLLGQDGQPVTAGSVAKDFMAASKASCEKAQTWIWDKMVESTWHSEFRLVIEDYVRLGTGVLKGPYPYMRKVAKFDYTKNALVITEEMTHGSKRIDPRNLFPAKDCGENIQRGSQCWERDRISLKELRALKDQRDPDGQPMYFADAIDECIRVGPGGRYEKDGVRGFDTDEFTIWYGYAMADYDQLCAAGIPCNEGDAMQVQITMVDDEVLRVVPSTLDSGEYPYDVYVMDRVTGHWTGTGIPHAINTQQRQLNAFERNWMDNAALSAGPIIAMLRNKIIAADGGPLSVRPFMLLHLTDENIKLSDALQHINIDSQGDQLIRNMQFILQRVEQIIGMPMTTQGIQGETPETLGGRQILQNNGNTFTRRVARQGDDQVIEPHVRRYYEHWLLYSGDKEVADADGQVEALGTTSFYVRDTNTQFALQLAPFLNDPEMRIDKNKWLKEVARGNRMDPARLQYTDEEWQQKMEEQSKNPPPPPPQVQVAQIREEGATKRQQIKSAEAVKKMELDTDRDNVYEQTMARREEVLQVFKAQELELKKGIAIMQENGEMARKLKESEDREAALKVQLAEATMKLKVQVDLANQARQDGINNPGKESPQVAIPPTEPPGRADAGRAFPQ